MTASLLEQLAPDHAPPPLGWWPLAPGWWGLMALLLMAFVLVMWWRKRRQRPSVKRWQRVALRELAQLEATANDTTIACGLQQLLRRYAIARYGRDTGAALSGDGWIAFVVRHGGSDWAGDSGRALLRCAYGSAATPHDAPASPTDRERWLRGARAFVRGARSVR